MPNDNCISAAVTQVEKAANYLTTMPELVPAHAPRYSHAGAPKMPVGVP